MCLIGQQNRAVAERFADPCAERHGAAPNLAWSLQNCAAVFLLLTVAGCSNDHVARAPSNQNRLRDASTAAWPFFAMSELGIDSGKRPPSGIADSSEISQLSMLGASVHRKLRKTQLPLPIEPGNSTAVRYLDANGGLVTVVLGASRIDGVTYFQLMPQWGPPVLVPESRLAATASEVWSFEGESATPFTLTVGSSSIAIDAIWKNLGVTETLSKIDASFIVTNTGRSVVKIKVTGTSCNCTAVMLDGAEEIAASESRALKAQLSTGFSENIRQSIHVTLIDPQTAASKNVDLWLFANQRAVIDATPHDLTFCRAVKQNSLLAANIHISQPITDICSILSVTTSPHLPFSFETKHRSGGGYLIEVTGDSARLSPGRHEYTMTINTSSRFRPSIEIPIVINIEPIVEIIPHSATFGLLNPNELAVQRLRLRSSVWSTFDTEVLSAPQGCEVEVKNIEGAQHLDVHVKAPNKGSLSGNIQLRATSGTQFQLLTVPLNGLVL